MGHDHTGQQWREKGISDWLCRFFAKHNVPYQYDQIEPGRGNVIARLPGDPSRPTVLLDAHQDTVPTAGMTIDPFAPTERDGRLYGRGACDVKGSMAAILSTVGRLKRENDRSHANLIVSMTCDEEHSQLGARHLVGQFTDRDSPQIPKPDMAIISEPTDLDVVVAHKGVLRWKIRTKGIAVHSSQPYQGNNAIYSMAKLASCLEQIAAELESHIPAHPLCGHPTLSVGTINGGESVNIVPDRCVIEIDRRIVPGESVESILRETRQALAERTQVEFEMLPPDTICQTLTDDRNQSLATTLVGVANEITGTSKSIGVSFTTHAPKFADAGIPTVVFGPGSIQQAHTKDEWIAIDQLRLGSEILYNLIKRV